MSSHPPSSARAHLPRPPRLGDRRDAEVASGEIAAVTASRRGATTIVARFPMGAHPDLAPLLPRALEVRKLETVSSEATATLGDAVHRVLRTAALVAAAFGAVGALLGALVFEGEALLPSVFGAGGGWVPGPLAGAAIGGGVLGVVGFLVGALAMLMIPSLAIRRAHDHATFVIVRARSFDLDAVVSRIVELGGTIAALGEG